MCIRAMPAPENDTAQPHRWGAQPARLMASPASDPAARRKVLGSRISFVDPERISNPHAPIFLAGRQKGHAGRVRSPSRFTVARHTTIRKFAQTNTLKRELQRFL